MRPLPHHLVDLARRRHGLVTAAELNAAGYRGRARQAALDAGALAIVHRGVYRLAGTADTFEQRCHAALLAAPHAVLSGPTAGRIWHLRKVHTDDIHLLSHRSVRLAGLNGHQTDLLGPSDIQTIVGLRTLRPPRLLCDLAWFLDDVALESVLEQMLDRRLLTISGARAAARRFTARGRPGSTRLVRVLDGRDDWLRPTESDLELRVWRRLVERIDGCVRQHEVALESGTVVRLDLAIPHLRLGIEIDHATWHGGRLDVARDKARDRDLMRVGWTVALLTDGDVERRLDAAVDQVVAIADRLSRGAA